MRSECHLGVRADGSVVHQTPLLPWPLVFTVAVATHRVVLGQDSPETTDCDSTSGSFTAFDHVHVAAFAGRTALALAYAPPDAASGTATTRATAVTRSPHDHRSRLRAPNIPITP